jgi:hypothetical protein
MTLTRGEDSVRKLIPRPAVLAIVLLTIAPARSAFAQAMVTWFDINPSTSNLPPHGASGGRVNRLAAASDFSRVYAATECGGLYTSYDQGNAWVRINTFGPSAASDVKVDPNNSQRVYATSFFDGKVNADSGLSISDDAGDTWRTVNAAALNKLTCQIPPATAEPHAWQIAINPNNTAAVFVGTSCGLARTLDTGATWTYVDPSPGGSAEQVFAVAAHGRSIVDVISDNGYFRSNDNGDTWTPVLAGPGPVAGNSPSNSTIAISPAEDYVLLAASSANIFESQDGGVTWPTSLTLPLRGDGRTNQQGRIPFVKTNQLSASNQFDVWFGDIHLFKTTGTTPPAVAPGGAARTPLNDWTESQDNAHPDVGDVLFDPRARAGACPWLFSNDGGIYRNTRQNNPSCQSPRWDQVRISPHATWLWGFDGIRNGAVRHALTYGLQDNGAWAATNVEEGHDAPPPNWNTYRGADVLHNAEGGSRAMSLQGRAREGREFRLRISNRDGSNDTEIPNYPSDANFTRSESGQQNAPFGAKGVVVNLGNPNEDSLEGMGVYFTNDITSGRISWTTLNAPDAPNSRTGQVKIANLDGTPNVYYHTGNGNPEISGVIFRSTLDRGDDTGSNWIPLSLPAGVISATAWDVDPNDGRRVIVAGINGVSDLFEIWMTQDFGASWMRLSNLETMMLGTSPDGTAVFVNKTRVGKPSAGSGFGTYWQPTLFKFNPNDPTTIVAGAADAGIFLSLDNGGAWQLLTNPVAPTSAVPHIPRPLFAYFSPGRFSASTNAFDVWIGSRGAGVMKAVIETPRPPG